MTDTNDIWRWPAHAVADAVKAGKITAVQAAESALGRMEAVNPALNAVVVSTADEALAAAAEVDRKLAAGEDPGLLAGVPVTIKTNVDQAGHATSNGLRLQKDLIAEIDSPFVASMRDAGAVIVGRTNTPAFSLRWFTRNSLWGTTKNPRDFSLTPGGSSGGAASAVASGMCAVAHGTDIAGSIRYPAYACGVHGIRPTFGRVPAVNFSGAERNIGGQLMAVSGPLARTIEDLRIAFAAMSAPDIRDSWYVPAPADMPALPKRAAICTRPDGMNTDPKVAAALEAAAEALRAAGWTVDAVETPPLRPAVTMQLILWMAEFRGAGEEALRKEDDPDANFVYAQLCRHAAKDDRDPIDAVLWALRERSSLVRQWQTFLAEYPVVLLPISAEPPFPDQLDVSSEDAFDRVIEAQLTQVALPVTGLPALNVTLAMDDGAALGVQMVGPRYREDVILDAAEVIERARPVANPVDPAG
ncbi:MAG: amidase family protein [Rhodospirillales bacterium]|nr:amidase family protein [Rhodospirillales bacterium]MBO6787289.1 amidase family protein [Rhodospirillales bacterium]